MARQTTEKDDSKVALDMADLPLPELEEEQPPAPVEDTAVFDPSMLAPEEPQKRGLPRLALLGGLALLLLLAAIWFMFLRTPGAEPEPEPAEPRAALSAPVGPPRATLEQFLIPVMPDPRGRLLKILVMLEFDSVEDMDAAMAENTPLIRDAIYRALRNRSLEDINNARLNNILPGQVKDSINTALGANMVKHIYFPDFLFAG